MGLQRGPKLGFQWVAADLGTSYAFPRRITVTLDSNRFFPACCISRCTQALNSIAFSVGNRSIMVSSLSRPKLCPLSCFA